IKLDDALDVLCECSFHGNLHTQKWLRFIENIEEVDKELKEKDVISPLKDDEKNGLYVALKSLDNSSDIHKDFLEEWKKKKYPFKVDRVPVPEHELNIQNHPSSCYTSRKFDHSARLNKTFSQELSSKIIIDQGEFDDDVVMLSEDLGDFMIKNLDS
ncbi:10768_t:CDS:2, partial [Funneliformis caledonium]